MKALSSCLGVALVGFVWVVHWAKTPAVSEVLTESQKRTIETRVRDLAFLGQLEYGIGEPVPPPTISYAIREPLNMAEATCDRAEVLLHRPAWTITVNPRLGALCFDELMTETLPHEVAHLVGCPLTSHWNEHTASWENITRYLGSEPHLYHSCKVSR